MRGQALALASAAAVALTALAPQPAAAQSPTYQSYASQDETCQKQRQNRMVAGGLIGALAGAVLGSNVAGRGAKSEAGVLGAVAGAVAGGALGRSTAKCGPYSNTYNGPIGSYEGRDGYRGDDYGLEGGPNTPSVYRGGSGYGGGYRQAGYGGRECRYGEQVLRDPDGRSYAQSVYMCRGDDGAWRAQ